MWVSMILSVLVGLAYVGWLAWTEGWRLWLVMGSLLLIAGVGGLVHMAMGMARHRDGLEGEAPETGVEETQEEE